MSHTLTKITLPAVDGGEEIGKRIGDGHAVDDIGHKDHGLIELRAPQFGVEQDRKGQLDRDHQKVREEIDRVVPQTLPQIGVVEHIDVVFKPDEVAGGRKAVPVGKAHAEEIDGREDHKAHQ